MNDDPKFKDDIRGWLFAPLSHRLNEIEHDIKEIKKTMATQTDLDTAEQTLLTAVQALAALVTSSSGSFDTSPEIATLTQISALVAQMTAKLSATGGVPAGVPVISSAPLAVASVNVPFTFQVVASNKPTSYTAVGLPAGLTINPTTGMISGTVNLVGVSPVTITVTNASGSATQALSITVSVPLPGAPVISSSLVATGNVNVPFTYQTVASNGPNTYSAVGLLAGLSIDVNSGLITGTPTVAGVTAINLMATNSIGSDTESLALTVNP